MNKTCFKCIIIFFTIALHTLKCFAIPKEYQDIFTLKPIEYKYAYKRENNRLLFNNEFEMSIFERYWQIRTLDLLEQFHKSSFIYNAYMSIANYKRLNVEGIECETQDYSSNTTIKFKYKDKSVYFDNETELNNFFYFADLNLVELQVCTIRMLANIIEIELRLSLEQTRDNKVDNQMENYKRYIFTIINNPDRKFIDYKSYISR